MLTANNIAQDMLHNDKNVFFIKDGFVEFVKISREFFNLW